MRKLIIFIAGIFLLPVATLGQGITLLDNIILKDRVLEKGTYLMDDNVRVTRGATLTLKPGVVILMVENAVLKIEGGLVAEGKPFDMVEINSINPEKEGVGILVSENSRDKISISYTVFEHLLVPLNFEKRWYRPAVDIHDNIFRWSKTGEPGIIIRNTDELLNESPIEFNFSRNDFVTNSSSILVEDIDADLLNFYFRNNLLTENYFYGVEAGGMFTSPFFSYYDGVGSNKLVFDKNSLYRNYLISGHNDTVIKQLNMGIAGKGKVFEARQNYYGYGTASEIKKSLDHFLNNSSSPFINFDPRLVTPSSITHAHIWKVKFNNELVSQVDSLNWDFSHENTLELAFNRPVTAMETDDFISFVYYDPEDDSLKYYPLKNTEFKWLNEDAIALTTINDTIYNMYDGFLKIRNFEDNEGFPVPFSRPGFDHFRHKVLKKYKRSVSWDEILYRVDENLVRIYPGQEGLTTQSGLYEKQVVETEKGVEEKIEGNEGTEIPRIDTLVGSTEIGFFAGMSTYYGDLTKTDIPNPRESDLAVGAKIQYNYSERFAFLLNFTYGKLKGDDLNLERGTGYYRGHSFKSSLYDLSFLVEMHLTKYEHTNFRKFIPSLSAGVGVFHFNPRGKFSGDWYDLQPLGTSGQTYQPGRKPYSLYEICLPFGGNIKKVISNDWTIQLSIEWRYTFTDYIDDVGGDVYPDPDKVRSANPDNPDIAEYFSDPSGIFKGRRGNPTVTDWYFFAGFSLTRIIRPKRQTREYGKISYGKDEYLNQEDF